MSTCHASSLERKILTLLASVGEASTANIGSECVKFTNGNASNPGTLAASACLRRMEKAGKVKSREESGKNFMRTLWRLDDKFVSK